MATAREVLMMHGSTMTLYIIESTGKTGRRMKVAFFLDELKEVIKREDVKMMLNGTAIKWWYNVFKTEFHIIIDDPEPLQNPQLAEDTGKKWIRVLNVERSSAGPHPRLVYRCPRCKWQQDSYSNYCPNCGLRLVEVE